MRLAEYSRDVLRELREQAGLQYEQRSLGTLRLFRSQAQLDAAARDVAVLRECGVPFALLGRDELARAEPALARVKDRLAGGLRLPDDETGDCHTFTRQLAARAAALGVEFRFAAAVEVERGRLAAVRLAGGEWLHADGCVVALGSHSPLLLRHAGIDVPVYPVKGYSLTVETARRGRRAGVDGARRDLQDRADAVRPAAAHRRHGRTGRVQPGAAQRSAHDAGDGRGAGQGRTGPGQGGQGPRVPPSAGNDEPGSAPGARSAPSRRVMPSISIVWLAMMSSARRRVAGSRPCFSTSRAISTAPAWCGIIMARKSMSGSPL